MDIFNTYKKIATKLIPDLKNNNFQQSGMLTKDEYLLACNYLSKNYNEWQMINVIDRLPYLILRDIQYKNISELLDEQNENGDENDWNICINKDNKKKNKLEKKVDVQNDTLNLVDFEEELEEFENDELTIDYDNSIEDKRIYDITRTYDNYYRTPRIWFHAKSLTGQNISNEKILEDFSIEHTNVSIKIETHPYYKLESVSVHPCKHADVMKKLIKIELENEKTVEVKQYFIYFLKFVSCIFPHISFDFTVFK